MASENPKRYGQVVLLARASGDTAAAEQRVFGLDHTEWGAAIGRQWGFPDDMVDAIADHHGGDSSGLAWVLVKARQQAAAMGIGDGVLHGGDEPPNGARGPGPLLRRVDAFVSNIRRAA